MNIYWECLKYIVVHKWAVYREARKLGLSVWQSLMHDMSKLGWLEFTAYARRFYKDSPTTDDMYRFDVAWIHHIHRNPHHWQHWVLGVDVHGTQCIRMPEKYVREMVADWRGVAYALGRHPDTAATWYMEHKHTIALHPQTRNRVEILLGVKTPLEYCATVDYPTPRKAGT